MVGARYGSFDFISEVYHVHVRISRWSLSHLQVICGLFSLVFFSFSLLSLSLYSLIMCFFSASFNLHSLLVANKSRRSLAHRSSRLIIELSASQQWRSYEAHHRLASAVVVTDSNTVPNPTTAVAATMAAVEAAAVACGPFVAHSPPPSPYPPHPPPPH